MAEENRNLGFVWFLSGLGVGALVSMLYAPKSGRECREDIRTGTRRASEYLGTQARRAADEAGAFIDKSREQMGNYVDRGKNLFVEQRDRVAAAVEAGRHAYQSGGDGGNQAER